MKQNFLIETSVIIAHLKNLPEAKILNTLSGNFFSSVICLGELYEGIFLVKERDQKKVKNGINNFFQSLDGILAVSDEIAKNFGMIRSQLRKRGQIIEDLDLLIGATCLTHNLTLVTLNLKHFKRIPNLKIV